ncbi:redox-sensitive transcriptional activator SoxR [Sphingobium sp. BHU LFT2]|uniref:redox-sensitive transcriptional activator SoxR n=1 Tax=Sphingobium sp. BHU LFT2 TaxID=2807634 RepID=UPI001BE5AF57|nr:redox-sensitive transcriptional activator SoxR [Sphingobium sp. BHU LFT2]MBT2245933.1 redox-sensitive transcriptional activator SoxR [Sphingobium sp. BHU LFT2]
MSVADSNDELTVGQVAKRSGVPVSTIHFYEAKGLIQGWRSAGNQRRYSRRILRRVAVIRIAQRAGLPLAIIKEHLDALPSEPISAKAWRSLTQKWRALLDDRITSLLQLRNQMESCIGCGCLSLEDCPLRNPGDLLASEGAGARLLVTRADALDSGKTKE